MTQIVTANVINYCTYLLRVVFILQMLNSIWHVLFYEWLANVHFGIFPFILKIKNVLSSALLYNLSYSGRVWLLANVLQASCGSYTPLSGKLLGSGKDRGRFPTMDFSVITFCPISWNLENGLFLSYSCHPCQISGIPK